MKQWKDTDFKLFGKYWFPSEEDGVTFKVLSGETELLNILKPYLKDNKVMVQAGGNVGMQIEKFAEFFDYVYSFEPEPKNFSCLNRNLSYKNIIKIQACLGCKHELQDMSPWGNECGGYHVGGNNPYIPTLLIDDLALNQCDLIQLDVEGFQLYALKGAENTIKKYKPVICVEEAWIERYGQTTEDIRNYLYSLGYGIESRYTSDYIYVYQKF